MAFSGKKLREARLAQGMTQAELAHKAHVRERQIIRWENDQHTPRLEAVRTLARVLRIPLADLLSDDAADGDDEEADPVVALMNAIRALVRAELAAAAEGGSG